jgi:hypothetical protein
VKSKIVTSVVALSLVLSLVFAVAGPVSASPGWNVAGTWGVNVIYLGTPYPETLVLTQTGDSITGVSLNSIPTVFSSAFTITSGSVSGNSITFHASYNPNSLQTMTFTGAIANDGSMVGTWADDLGFLGRTGSWASTSGQATQIGSLSAATLTGTDVHATMTVTAPTVPNFGQFVFGDNKVVSSADGAINVVLNSQNPTTWSVTARDYNTDVWSGYMTSGPVVPGETGKLTNKLEIATNAAYTGWNYADAGITYSGSIPVASGPLPFYATQNITNADAANLYTITIIFTGSLGGF